MIEKISKLLAAADGAKTPEESEAFYAKAQALCTVHAISLAQARQASVDRRRIERPTTRWISIGPKKRHVNRALITMLFEVARVNDVIMDIRTDNTSCTLYGLPSDLALVEELWSRIATTMIRFADTYMAAGQWRDEVMWRTRSSSASGPHSRRRTIRQEGWYPVTAQAARASYLDGFIRALGTRLQAERAAQISRSEAAEHFHEETAAETSGAQSDSGAALVLARKSEEIRSFYEETTTARGSWRGARRSGQAQRSHEQGRADGARMPLSSATPVGGPARQLGRGS